MTVTNGSMRELTLLPASEELFAELRGSDSLRAVGMSHTTLFAYAAGTSDANYDAAVRVCGDDQDCIHYLLLLLGRVGLSELVARELNVKAFLRLARGSVAQYREIYRGVEAYADGVDIAGAYLVGDGEFDVLVEITGDEPELVLDALLRLTDLDIVEAKDVHHFAPSRTDRWGTAAS